MDLQTLKETDIWGLYQTGKEYNQRIGLYEDSDKNFRFFNGDQWYGLKHPADIEPVQLNFIKPIVKYKVTQITSNLYQPKHSAENFENKEFMVEADRYCKLFDKRSSKIWEKDKMDKKIKRICKSAAVNSEGIMYVKWDEKSQLPINILLSKNDVLYGDENIEELQEQPYILTRQRFHTIKAREIAKEKGVSDDQLKNIIGDIYDVSENSGDNGKIEKDDKVTILTKMWKEKGTIWFQQATRFCDFGEPKNSGLPLYPLAHMIWEEKEGYSRGEGEVKPLIPNQIENNKLLLMRLISIKQNAFPQKVVDVSRVTNPSALNKVGSILTANGFDVTDVNKVIAYLSPAQMSPDVSNFCNEIITTSRNLNGAGEFASGDVNPEQASGRAILAIQNASKTPLTEHLSNLKDFIEDISRIWFNMQVTYSKDGLSLEEEYIDPSTGQTSTRIIKVNKSVLDELKVSIKIDVTPKGAFDSYAQELSLENLLKMGYFNAQKIQELKLYVEALDDDSVMPKKKLKKIIETFEEEQRKISQINQQVQMAQMKVNNFLDSDENSQAGILNQGMQSQNNNQQMLNQAQ